MQREDLWDRDEYRGPPEEPDDWDGRDWSALFSGPEPSDAHDSDDWPDDLEPDWPPDPEGDGRATDAARPGDAGGERPPAAPAAPKESVADAAARLMAEFDATSDPWIAVRAACQLRRARQPRQAVDFLWKARASFETGVHPRARAALLTVFAGSEADLRQFRIARRAAERARELAPDKWHPHRVIARIDRLQQRHAAADAAFDLADQLETEAAARTGDTPSEPGPRRG
ncbi:MAG: hypothetical protein AB7P02_00435 [Alphaproteobacteria bacterium]